LVTYVAAVVDR